MKFIRDLKKWEKDLIKSIISGGTNSYDNTGFKGLGVYLDTNGYHYYVMPWNASGVRKIFKGVKP